MRQDHTTSPSAKSAVRQKRICVHRIPCPTFVTIAKRPFVWAGTAEDVEVIWVRREWEYFCNGGWTGGIRLNAKQNFFSAVIPGHREAMSPE
jgi:hypothetical protein